MKKVPSGRAKDWFRLHGFESVPEDMCEFWEKIPNMPCFWLLREFDITPDWWIDDVRGLTDSKKEAFLEWSKGNTEFVRNIMKEHQDLKSEIDYYLGLFDVLTLHKKYLYHHDLQMNRYYGALMQIDQYLKFKNIPVVHCIGKTHWYPTWFTFETGVVDSEIYKLQHEITGYYAFANDSENNMNIEGNQIAFDSILPLINQALEKVK